MPTWRLAAYLEAGRVTAADVFQRLAHPCPGKGLIWCWPIRPIEQAREEGWLEKLAILLAKGGWIKPGGVWVYETEGKDALPELPGWRLARDKRYGSTRLLFWVREGRDERNG